MIGRCGIRTGARSRPCDPLFSTGNGFLLRVADALSPAKARRVSDCLDTIRQRIVTLQLKPRPLKSLNPTLIVLFWLAANTAVGISTATDLPFRSSKPFISYFSAFTVAQVSEIVPRFRNFAYAFRLEDAEYRNKVEDVIECMKLDGRLGKLHEKWYGTAPDSGSAIDTVYFGYGPPGFKGFEPTAHVPSCK
jgi:polar amino acid transport system substrate-binding protein